MAVPEEIILPTRKPDMDVWGTERWQIETRPDNPSAEGGRYWHIASDPELLDTFPSQIEELSPDVVTCWLLEGTQKSAGRLISPYAKLEITREYTAKPSEEESLFGRLPYRFRLVTMEEVDSRDEMDDAEQPKALSEYKLLAGSVFECVDDADALLLCHAALSGFRLGKIPLRDPDEWERLFR